MSKGAVIPTGKHYIKIVYVGPKPAEEYETRPEFEIELKNTSLEHVKRWLEVANKIVDSEFTKNNQNTS